jgi:hypothetical protein
MSDEKPNVFGFPATLETSCGAILNSTDATKTLLRAALFAEGVSIFNRGETYRAGGKCFRVSV